MKAIVIISTFLMVSFCYFGQQSVVIEKKDVLIGEQFYIYYRLPVKANDKITYSPLKNNLEAYILTAKKDTTKIDIDILEPFKDSIFINGAKREWVGKYKVTIWDSGEVNIPSISLKLNDSIIIFDKVIVNSSLVKHIEGKEIYDIKEDFSVLPDKFSKLKSFFAKYWMWLLGLYLLALIITLFIVRRKKKAAEATIISIEELAIQKIEKLNQRKLWLDDKLKDHYIELSYILRDYLAQKFELNLLEKTTYETTLLLGEKELSSGTINSIAEILEKSDLVKFAKSIPEEYEILKTSTITIQIIKEVSNLN